MVARPPRAPRPLLPRREVRGLGRIPALVLGAMAIDHDDAYDARAHVLESAFVGGIDVIDTAPLYGFGASERVIGRFLAETKVPMRVLTKVGLRWDAAGDHGDVLFRTPERTVRKDARPASIREEVHRSLERLRLPKLALVQLHHADRHVPLDESLSALVDLHREGRLDAVGVSNHAPDAVEAADRILMRLSGGRLALSTLQDPYSLLARAPENGLFAVARARSVGVLAYSPLAQGLLSGAMGPDRALPRSDWRGSLPLFSRANRAVLETAIRTHLAPIAARHETSVSSVALRWAIDRPEIGAAIVGARTGVQLAAALDASRVVLTPEERVALGDAFAALPLRTRAPIAERILRRFSR